MFLVCGEALFDFFLKQDSINILDFEARMGGSPYNVAVGLGRLSTLRRRSEILYLNAVHTTLGPKIRRRRPMRARRWGPNNPVGRRSAYGWSGLGRRLKRHCATR
jgi:hypothetical protein